MPAISVDVKRNEEIIGLLIEDLMSLGCSRLILDAPTGGVNEWTFFSSPPDSTAISEAVPAIIADAESIRHRIIALLIERRGSRCCEGIAITRDGISMTIGKGFRWQFATKQSSELLGKPVFIAWNGINSIDFTNNILIINQLYPLCCFWVIDNLEPSLKLLLGDSDLVETVPYLSADELFEDIGIDPGDNGEYVQDCRSDQAVWSCIVECCLRFMRANSNSDKYDDRS